MRAITIRQPFAWAIAAGHKRIENRSWRPSARWTGSWVAIHAAAGMDDVDPAWIRRTCRSTVPSVHVRSAIVAVARLAGTVSASKSPWFRGPLGWVLDDAIAIEPLPASGQLGLWRLSAEQECEVERRVRVEDASEPKFQLAWLVKGKRAITDWNEIARVGATSTWFTRRPPRDWAPGDGVALWEAAPGSRLIGFAQLTGKPRLDRTGETHFKVRTTRVLAEPIAAPELRRIDDLLGSPFLKSGPAGTVFRLRGSEMNALTAAAAQR